MSPDDILKFTDHGISLRMGPQTIAPDWSLGIELQTVADIVSHGGTLEWKNDRMSRVHDRPVLVLASLRPNAGALVTRPLPRPSALFLVERRECQVRVRR